MLSLAAQALCARPPANTKVDTAAGLSPSVYLGVLGMPDADRLRGVLDIAALKPGDVVFVSGAAGR